MSEQRVDALASAMDDVEHALRQSGFFQQLDDWYCGERDLLARFEDESIAAGEREREHPQRHHRREIEWRDADANPERLVHRFAINRRAPDSRAYRP